MSYTVTYTYQFTCDGHDGADCSSQSRPYPLDVERASAARSAAELDGWKFDYDHKIVTWRATCPGPGKIPTQRPPTNQRKEGTS